LIEPTLHLAHVVTPLPDGSIQSIPEGALVVDARGMILAVGERRVLGAAHPDAAVEDHGTRLLIPGFVDAHVHLAQVYARARIRGELLEWLQDAIFPAEARFADASHAERAARAFVSECIRCGVTSAAIFLTSHAEAAARCFTVVAESGLRAVMGLVHMDRGGPQELLQRPATSLAAAERLAGAWHGHDGGRIRYALTPRFPLACSDELLAGLGALNQSGADFSVHTHLAESEAECAAVLKAFPRARDYLDVYEQAGLVGPRTILAHGIHLSEREIEALARSGAGVAHCPSSNMFLKSGVFAWQRHVAATVRFGLGSDVGAGSEMSPWRVMRDAYGIQPAMFLSAEDLFWRATLGGAQAIGLDQEIGSLESGKQADFLVIDTSARPELAALNGDSVADILAALVFLGDDRVVQRTHVRGRRLTPVDGYLFGND